MSFNSWAKQLILSEIKSEGQATYNKEGWFCATSTGFLLHVQFDRIPYGVFRINYNIMPLVSPLNEDYRGIYMNMGGELDAGLEYFNKLGVPLGERPEFRTKEFESHVTRENCTAVIRHYLNPLFSKIDSLQSCCIQHIREMCDNVYSFHSLQRRDIIAKDLFLKGYSDGVEKPPFWKDVVPSDYPWYAQRMNGVPFVYAALGKYKEALACMEYRYRSFRMNSTTSSLYKAMHKNDVEECNAILDRIYQKNRMAIEDTLGLTPPEGWQRFTGLSHNTGDISNTGD